MGNVSCSGAIWKCLCVCGGDHLITGFTVYCFYVDFEMGRALETPSAVLALKTSLPHVDLCSMLDEVAISGKRFTTARVKAGKRSLSRVASYVSFESVRPVKNS